MTSLLVLLATAHAACPDPQPALTRAMDSLVAGDPEAARRALADVEGAFSCTPFTPAVLARHWLARGALADQEGEDATQWFAVARHVSPETWEPRLGPVLRASWEGAAAPSASLAIDPGGHAWVDGTLVTAWPVPSTAGPHLVQVLDPTGAVTFARVVTLLQGERALVETGIAVPTVPMEAPRASPAAPVSSSPTPQPARRRRMLLASSAGALLTLGGVASWQARAQDDAMERAPDLEALDKAYGSQVAWAWTAWGALGAGAACALSAAVVR